MTRVAVNGFGRIGRSFVRAALERPALVDVVAANDTNDAAMLGYLLEYDTVQGPLTGVELGDSELRVGPLSLALFHEADPSRLPWAQLGVDVVIEATGRFTDADAAAGHVLAGARRVVISAPASGADVTVCMGVNHERFDPGCHVVVSNGSCTTNCLAAMAYVLHERFGIVDGFMSTVHAYTNVSILVRERDGRDAEPSAGIVDARSVQGASTATSPTRGFDAGKKVSGRKTFGVVDTLGLLVAVVVAANVSDNAGGCTSVDRARPKSVRLAKLWCDAGFKRAFARHCRRHRVKAEVVSRTTAHRFEVLPRRWVVERTWAWLVNHRRLRIDYERDPAVTTEGFVWAAHARLLLRRLTTEPAP